MFAQIVFEAGYDASAGQMRDAIRALLNGAYGQDVAAWLREGGAAGGRVPPGGKHALRGHRCDFPGSGEAAPKWARPGRQAALQAAPLLPGRSRPGRNRTPPRWRTSSPLTRRRSSRG